MGGHDHCCAVGCSNRRGVSVDGEKVSFYTFPKNTESRQLWVARVNRADLRLEDVTAHTVLCSVHFVNGRKSPEQPDPVFFSHRHYPYKRKVRTTLEFAPALKRPKQLHQPKSLKALAHDAVREQLQRKSLLEAENIALREKLKRALFHPESFSGPEDERIFKFFTGITYPIFTALVEYMRPTFTSLYLRHGQQQPHREEISEVKLGRPRALSYEAEFFLVLMKLRLALKDSLLACLFGLRSKSQVSAIFTSWISHLAKELAPLLTWPTAAQVQANLPNNFRDHTTYKKCRVILDCWEAEIQRPSSFSTNAMVFSPYKDRPTYKVLTGVTPDGYVSFVSSAYPGSISDPAITRESGILDKLDAGDGLMADKGFTLSAADLQPRGLHLVLPPFKNGDKQMEKGDVVATKEIANRRIVVENAIGRMRQ